MADGGSTTGGIALPPKNVELREKEEALLHGDDLALTVTVSQSDIPPLHVQVKGSTEVGYVKLLLAEKMGVEAGKLRLYYRQPRDGAGNEKEVTLIDPMSLCDFKVYIKEAKELSRGFSDFLPGGRRIQIVTKRRKPSGTSMRRRSVSRSRVQAATTFGCRCNRSCPPHPPMRNS